MNIKGLSANSSTGIRPNEYLYNGKMIQDEMGLNLLDYGARFYGAVLGRWYSMDPLAENTPNWPPYVYCNNSPVVMIDPDGRYSKFGTNDNTTITSSVKVSISAADDDAGEDVVEYKDGTSGDGTEYNTRIVRFWVNQFKLL